MTSQIKTKLLTTVEYSEAQRGEGMYREYEHKERKELERSTELIIAIWQRSRDRPGREPEKPGWDLEPVT